MRLVWFDIVACWRFCVLRTPFVDQDVDGKEDIVSYIERVYLYLAANYVSKDHKSMHCKTNI